jgi:hypothetical protein
MGNEGACVMVDGDDPIDQIGNHLEFLGYEIKKLPGELCGATHDHRLNLIYTNRDDVVVIHVIVALGTKIGGKHYKAVNDINVDVGGFGTTCIDSEGDLVFRSWFHKPYTRKTFAEWMEMWGDVEALIMKTFEEVE